MIKDIKELTQLNGIPSKEKKVIDYLVNKLGQPDLKDNLGSIDYKKGHGKRVMLAAHTDEVGMIVKSITQDGFIKFQPVGAIYQENILGHMFNITTKSLKVYPALMAHKPLMLRSVDEKEKTLPMKDFFLDAGFKSKEEVLKAGIQIGDMITPIGDLVELANDKIASKALDDRIGVYILKEVYKNIEKINCELHTAFTVSEEFGLKGAKTISYLVEPDLAIAVDVGAGFDVPGGDKEGNTLGAGPQIYAYDAGLIAHQGLRHYVLNIAKENNIPYQESVMNFGRTDAAMMSLSKAGAPSLFIGIPTRYIHSNYAVIDKNDVLNTIQLLIKFVESLDEEKINQIILG